jgi:sporadic carbohydrate cluster 2OG-Fe(II) oxygenase
MDAANRMSASAGFLGAQEAADTAAFLEAGHLIAPVADRLGLERLRGAVVELAAAHLGIEPPEDEAEFLNHIHDRVTPADLNPLRLAVINGLGELPWARQAYFGLARQALDLVVGNELAMQRRLNLSIQLPGDDSSLLHVHADVWDGDSPFEIVVWLPLVDCRDTKSMFLLPPAVNARVEAELGAFDGQSADHLFERIEPDLSWIEIAYGEVLLFTQNLMHGNRVNREDETRWSLNCRFKSLLSPYADKRLGEFFEPITVRAATRLGMGYRLPEGFSE